jgi:uncharacterized protein YkwD
MILVSLAVAAIATAVSPFPATLVEAEPIDVPAPPALVERDVLAAVNAIRAEHGCGPLRVDARLKSAAERHARAMATQDFFDHVAPDGTTPAARVAATGYVYARAAENLAAGPRAAERAVALWMGSPPHRRNILDCSLLDTGIAYLRDPDDQPFPGDPVAHETYWVQVFGRPLAR